MYTIFVNVLSSCWTYSSPSQIQTDKQCTKNKKRPHILQTTNHPHQAQATNRVKATIDSRHIAEMQCIKLTAWSQLYALWHHMIIKKCSITRATLTTRTPRCMVIALSRLGYFLVWGKTKNKTSVVKFTHASYQRVYLSCVNLWLYGAAEVLIIQTKGSSENG